MFQRRTLLKGLTALPLANFAAAPVLAADYPARRVQVLVTTAPGGSSDIVTRLTCQFVSDRLGQSFLVDNRPGAGGNIAVELAHRAPADGYTLLAIHKGMVAANSLADNLSFDFMGDFEPVAGVSNGPLLMLMHPSVPVNSLAEFIAYAKANPSKINFASAGNGSDPHLAGELFKMMAGVQMTHVPYRGGALAFTDLLGGNVQMMFTNLPAAEYITPGKLRAIAVTTANRSKANPDIPSVAEQVPGYEVGVWFAYVMRRGAPGQAVDVVNRAVNAALADKNVQAGLAVLDSEPLPMSPTELGKFLETETEKWARVIRTAHIKAE